MAEIDKQRKEEVKKYRDVALALSAGTFAFSSLIAKVRELAEKLDSANSWADLNYLPLMLMVSVLLLGIHWFVSTYRDMVPLDRYITKVDYNGISLYASYFSVAIVISILFQIVDNILLFCITYLTYCVIDLWINFIMMDKLRISITDSLMELDVRNKDLPESDSCVRSKNCLGVLNNYYVKRNHVFRVVLHIIAISIAFSFSFSARLIENRTDDMNAVIEALNNNSYLICIATIITGETLLLYWRLKRDRELKNFDC